MTTNRGLGRYRGAALLIAAIVTLAALPSRAEETAPAAGAPPAGAAWSNGWKAGIEETQRDVVSGETMVVLAYGAVFVVLMLYVLRLSAEMRALRRETEELRRAIEDRGGSGASGG